MSLAAAPPDATDVGAPPAAGSPTSARRAPWVAVLVLVAVVAFASRLVPVLRGGGLFGLNGYDGGVYYAASAGLTHGLWPYADFLLLHPPGILLALLPFGALGRLVGHPDAMAVARLAWMLLGTASALLAVAALRRQGLFAALVGGLLYAVALPATIVERTTALEAVTGLLTLGAVCLLGRSAPAALTQRAALAAGLLLGASSATKIWGVAPLLVVAVWCVFEHGRRRALTLLLAAAAATVVICLPFFVLAPRTMWDMVVGAQLGRRRTPVSWYTKAVDTAWLGDVQRGVHPLLVLVGLLVVVSVALALRSRLGRLAVVLLGVGLAVLAISPAWTPHYASLVAGPLALLGGQATGIVVRSLARVPAMATTAAVLVLAGVGGYLVLSAPHTTFGSALAGRTIGRLVATVPGCVTSDDPTVLVEAGILDRNIERGCPLMVDLGGYSYSLEPGARLHVGRSRNEQWQRFVLDHLSSGDAAVVVRFERDVGFSRSTKDVVESWPVLGDAGSYVVRRPVR